ncbi:t-SNARE [Melanogaster broomeanus]|nr:t-SNARE [Melanogaster broomeanus]
MSIDPYHVVQQEIQSSLQTASTLHASYLRIRGMARDGSEELVWARNELKATLAALEADLEDLEESVKVVESTGPRLFNLDDAEVANRRRYVGRVRREIESMRAEIKDTIRANLLVNPTQKPQAPPRSTYSKNLSPSGSRSLLQPTNHEPQTDHHQDEQSQTATMDSISGTLTTLAQQAGLMGQEIGQHNEMLDDLEQNVDGADTKLRTAMRKLTKFIRQTEETKSGWCITILVIVLLTLLVAVIWI